MDLKLRVWRQARPARAAARSRPTTSTTSAPTCRSSSCSTCSTSGSSPTDQEPVAFDHDCREGICGSCSMMINGRAARARARHRDLPAPHAQVRGRRRDHGRAVAGARRSRSSATSSSTAAAFDRIIEAGGYITAPTGSAPDANLILVPKEASDAAMDAAACIGCGACVAACPNGAAQLFTAAKVAHLGLLPQGQPRALRAGRRHGRDDGELLRLLHATTASARRRARRRSASTSSRCSTATT